MNERRTVERPDIDKIQEKMDNFIETYSDYRHLIPYINHLESTLKDYQEWVDDLQSGMYINCVYCGYRYGPTDDVPSTMAQALEDHIKECPKHPLSKMRKLAEKSYHMLMQAQDIMRKNECLPFDPDKAFRDLIKDLEDEFGKTEDNEIGEK